MTWTTPKTWVVDELVTAGMMNEQIRDNLLYLYGHRLRLARFSHGTAVGVSSTTYASGDWRTVTLDSEDDDPDGIAVLASNQVTVGSGRYLFHASVNVNMNASQGAHLRLYDTTHSAELGRSMQLNSASTWTRAPLIVVGHGVFTESTVIEVQIRPNGTIQHVHSGILPEIYNQVYIVKLSD